MTAETLLGETKHEPRQLTSKELVALADKLVNATSEEEADKLERQLIEGFYGKPYCILFPEAH